MVQTSLAPVLVAGLVLAMSSDVPVISPGTVSMTTDRSRWESEGQRKSTGLPSRPFLYTLDQVAMMLAVSENYVKLEYAHWAGRSVGTPSPDRIVFRNIAPNGSQPEWRCSERELIRFLRTKGYKYYERGFVH